MKFFVMSFFFYGTAFVFNLRKFHHATFCFMLVALSVGCYDLYLGVYHSWPMLPMYQGLPALVCCLGFVWILQKVLYAGKIEYCESLVLQLLIIFLNLLAIFFPKDFYLPFIRSATIWSYIFFWTGVLAKGFLLVASVLAFCYLMFGNKHKKSKALAHSMDYALWGFVFLTLSMFSGEIWSYIGWGTPVVWHDPAITTVISLWFYWVCLLHLHYSTNWSIKGRALFMSGGGVLLIILCIHPDLGPLRIPFGR